MTKPLLMKVLLASLKLNVSIIYKLPNVRIQQFTFLASSNERSIECKRH